MKFDITNTMYGDAIQSAHMGGLRYVPLPNTTINEKLGIVVPVPDDLIPTLGYYTLGLSYTDMLENSSVFADKLRHMPKDVIPFKHIPFVCKPIGEDLTMEERKPYALRTEFIKDGTLYAAYYAKKFSEKSSHPIFIEGSMEGDDVSINYFVPDGTELNPIPVTGMDIQAPKIDFLATTIQFKLRLTSADFILIKEAVEIIYPTIDTPIINEVVMLTGIPVIMDGVTELAICQAAYFIKENFNINLNIENAEYVETVSYELGSLNSKITRTSA